MPNETGTGIQMRSSKTPERGNGLARPTTATSPSGSPAAISATANTEKDEVEDTNHLLQHDEEDEGRVVQMFSFLRNDWVDVRIEAFDNKSGAHKISYVDTGKQEWQNLRRKALRRAG